MGTEVKLTEWKPEDDLDTPQAQAEFITAALEENDAQFLARSLAVVCRAKGMPGLAALLDAAAVYAKDVAVPKDVAIPAAAREMCVA